jgi:hypothetical protein
MTIRILLADKLRHAVRVTARGDAFLSPSITRRLIAEFTAQPGRRRHAPPVGRRDRAQLVVIAYESGLGMVADAWSRDRARAGGSVSVRSRTRACWRNATNERSLTSS